MDEDKGMDGGKDIDEGMDEVEGMVKGMRNEIKDISEVKDMGLVVRVWGRGRGHGDMRVRAWGEG